MHNAHKGGGASMHRIYTFINGCAGRSVLGNLAAFNSGSGKIIGNIVKYNQRNYTKQSGRP